MPLFVFPASGWKERVTMNAIVVVSKHSEQYVSVRFPYRPDYVDRIKGIPGRRWNPGEKVWLVPYTLSAVALLVGLFRDTAQMQGELAEECGFVWEWLDETVSGSGPADF
ncbi:hypothetical protein [Paenibacillus sp. MBLB4367]|uniref:hypothetical protein n=1 Tax=Paenibacillus sp. MBLB4367 TaxID=3384767 RepID=UPI0039084411